MGHSPFEVIEALLHGIRFKDGYVLSAHNDRNIPPAFQLLGQCQYAMKKGGFGCHPDQIRLKVRNPLQHLLCADLLQFRIDELHFPSDLFRESANNTEIWVCTLFPLARIPHRLMGQHQVGRHKTLWSGA